MGMGGPQCGDLHGRWEHPRTRSGLTEGRLVTLQSLIVAVFNELAFHLLQDENVSTMGRLASNGKIKLSADVSDGGACSNLTLQIRHSRDSLCIPLTGDTFTVLSVRPSSCYKILC
jgi:hypothetical protein